MTLIPSLLDEHTMAPGVASLVSGGVSPAPGGGLMGATLVQMMGHIYRWGRAVGLNETPFKVRNTWLLWVLV